MKAKRMFLLLMAAVLMFSLCGCGETVNKITDSVVDAAKAELEAQLKATLEEYKVELVELKTAVGKLNDEGSDAQIFCAALVKSNSDAVAKSCAETLGKAFTDAGVLVQTGSKIESGYLVHKDISFNHSDFSAGGYYTIYVYHADLTAGLPSING